MFEYKVRSEPYGGAKFYSQDVLLFDYAYEGDIDIHCNIDYVSPGFGVIIAEYANDITESENIYIAEITSRNEYRIIKKEHQVQKTIKTGSFLAGKDIVIPSFGLDLSFKFTEDNRIDVYSSSVLLFTFWMDHQIKQYKTGFYSNKGNVLKNCIIYSKTPSEWVHNIWNGRGGRINWIKNGFEIEECAYPCDVECQRLKLEAGRYYFSFECDNPDIEFFVFKASKKIELEYEKNLRGAMRYFSKDTPILITTKKEKEDGSHYYVTESRMFEEIYDPRLDDISSNRWIQDSRFLEQVNILQVDTDGNKYIELSEPSSINLLFRGRWGRVTEIAIKDSAKDSFVATNDSNILVEGGSIIIDSSKIARAELEVTFEAFSEAGSFILESSTEKFFPDDLEVKEGTQHTVVLDVENSVLIVGNVVRKISLNEPILNLLVNMDAVISKFLVTDYSGITKDFLLQKTYKAFIPKTITSPIICLDSVRQPLDLSSDYREVAEYAITTDIFNKYNELKLSKTPIFNSSIKVAGVKEGVTIYHGENLLEENATAFEIIHSNQYVVDYINRVVKLPAKIKNQYKYILVEYEHCDDYYYEFTNYHRELVELESSANIYLDSEVCNVQNALIIYGVPKEAVFLKELLFRVPDKRAINSIDYCTSVYEEIPSEYYSITTANRLILDTSVREQYSYLVIEYLKENSYAVNERDNEYEIDIASSGSGTIICYDGNEYDVTEQFKVLGINIDNAVKDNFIVLQKDKKGDI